MTAHQMRTVIQFSTGNVGRHSLRAIIGRPDLELAVTPPMRTRMVATPPNSAGSTPQQGVVATDDIDALIALAADCVVYTAQGETRTYETLEQLTKFYPLASMWSPRRWFGLSPRT